MKTLFGCCLAFVIVMLVIIGLLVGGTYYVLNMTFDELGLSDYVVVNNKTIAELGLSDVKLIDVYRFIKTLMEGANEEDIVTHPYTEQDLENVKGKLGEFYNEETEEFDFGDTGGGFVVFNSADPITFLDTELAALFNYILTEGIESSENESGQEGENGEDNDTPPDMSIKEVKLTENTEGDGATIRTVIKIDISGIKEQLMQQIPSQYGNFINLGDAIYIVTESEIAANAEGRLTAGEEHSVTINNIPSSVSTPFLNFIANAVAESSEDGFIGVDGQVIEPDEGFFAEMVCGIFAEFIYRFGLVGESASNLGNSGFSTEDGSGAITIVPWTITTVPANESYQDEVAQVIAKADAGRAYYAADILIDRISKGDAQVSHIDTVEEFIARLESEYDIDCIAGETGLAGQIIIDITYEESVFNINAVYSGYGSYICNYQDYNNFNLQRLEDYEYGEVTQSQLQQIAALATVKEAAYAVMLTSYDDEAGNITIADNNVEEFITVLNDNLGLNLLIGDSVPVDNGVNVKDIVFQGGVYDYESAVFYARYGHQTLSYSFN